MVYFKGISGRKNILKYVCPVKTLVQTGLAFVFLVCRTFPSILFYAASCVCCCLYTVVCMLFTFN